MKKVIVLLKSGAEIKFVGKHKGHMHEGVEHPNWHYYELEDGRVYHFRKDQMAAVLEVV